MTADPRCWDVEDLAEHAMRAAVERDQLHLLPFIWPALLDRLSDSEIRVNVQVPYDDV